MFWIAIALVAPLLHGFANVLDNYLTGRLFKNFWTLAFFSAAFGVLFLPLVFLFEIPGLPPLRLLPVFLLIGAINVFYLIPYYKALQHEDTSVVISLFSLGRIFTPLLAFVFVREILQPLQYLGFFIIILSAAALSFSPRKKVRWNKSFFYMLESTFLLALEAVAYKYIFADVGWGTGFFWSTIFTFLITASFLVSSKFRARIGEQFRRAKGAFGILAADELLTFGGSAAAVYAISLAPVTLVSGIESFQPFCVLLYALLLKKYFPALFREKIDGPSAVKKLVLFGALILGVALVAV